MNVYYFRPWSVATACSFLKSLLAFLSLIKFYHLSITMSSLAGSTIGRTTIVCGWVLTTVAFVGIGFVLWARRLCHIHLEADDYLLIVAFLITVGLVAQITWAIVDDFQDMHVAEVPRTQLALIANVCSKL